MESKPLSARDIATQEKKRLDIKKEIYRAILDQFSRKIKSSFDLGFKSTVLVVPAFMIGYPRYEIGPAVKYMGRQLVRLGYHVTVAGPVSYEVSWSKAKPAEEEIAEPEFEFPSLMNLKKSAAKYK
jgi:hypothetical protein